MATVALEGTGATIAFSVSSFVADLITLTLPEESVSVLDTTHLGTTVAKTAKPATLISHGDISAEFDHVPGIGRLTRVQQNFTIAWPLRSGETTPYKRVYSGFVKSQGGEEMKTDTKMVTKVTIQVSGDFSEIAAT